MKSEEKISTKDRSWDMVCELWKRGDYSYFIPPEKFPKQEQAFELLVNTKEPVILLYGGAAGGGKSMLGWIWLLMECLTKPNLYCIVGHKEMSNLEKTLGETIAEVERTFGVPNEKGCLYKYDGIKHIWKFKNKSKIAYISTIHKPSQPNYDNFGSLPISYAWLEEAPESPRVAYDTLAHTRCGRQFDLNRKYGYQLSKVLLTANPDKGWLFTTFYQPWKDNNLKQGMYFIPALATDNPKGKDYVENNLKNIDDPVQRARLLEGNWEYEENQFQLFKHEGVLPMITKPYHEDQMIGETFISCDSAGAGKDIATIWVWKGYTAVELHIAAKCKIHEIVDRITLIENKYQSSRENTIPDNDGLGTGVSDYLPNCTPFRNASSAILDENDKDKDNIFQDLKTQTYYKFSEKVKEGVVTISRNLIIDFFGTNYPKTKEKFTDIKVRDAIREELEAILQVSKPEDKKYKISDKRSMKRVLGRSPDLADGLMFRFVKEVAGMSNAKKEVLSIPIRQLMSREEEMFNKAVGY